ncbi:MAG: DNA replication/repair protein RecF [Proteobacteria bacterium]|nr:DNA replication/repair protein RecF [Pseudomonadota bacterium]MCP4917113.1 DNA replication/repair protein RecF [Pseudomonadota bacterium]
MKLLRLSVRDWRNLPEVDVECDADFVVFWGDNAQGKTNLLEAVYGLATLKSFRTRKNRELVRWGADRALVKGRIHDGHVERELKLEVTHKSRSATIDGKPPRVLREYFDGIRAVLFAPEDVAIVRGAPDLRRAFVDRAAFTASSTFLEVAQLHRRLLDQKAALLRRFPADRVQLSIFDEQLAQAGAHLVLRRRRIVGELDERFGELHSRISGHGDSTMRYRSCLPAGDEVEPLAAAYLALLEQSRDGDIERGANRVGPQRDDLVLQLDEKSARNFASQGQARSVVLALKLSELLAARERGARPLFLLDDLSSELDRLRRGRLVELLSDLDLQCFVTTTDPSVVAAGTSADVRSYEVENGGVTG